MTAFGRKALAALVVLGALLAASAAVSVTIGGADIGGREAYRIIGSFLFGGAGANPLEASEIIVLRLRLPRILMAIATGAALSLTGAVLQGVFRNPLANPYVLGISSGAALGVSIGSVLGFVQPLLIQGSAFVGAMGSLLLVLAIATAAGGAGNSFSLLLSGISVSLFLSAITSLIMYLNEAQAERILFWTFGSLSTSSWRVVRASVPALTVGMGALLFTGRRLNILMQGDEIAQSLGMQPGRSRFLILTISSFVTAAAVSFVGIIGFVGLLMPHAVRLVLGPDNRVVMPVSVIAGSVFLLTADTVGRLLISPAEVPVGIVTALVGAPYLLILLVIQRRGRT